MVVRKQIIDDNEKCRQIAGDFGCHRIRRYNERHITQWSTSRASLEVWMPPLVECLCCIAPAAAMVDEFE